MGSQLLFYTLLALIPALGTSDFLITNIRNVKKRNAANTITDGIDIYSMNTDCRITSRFSHNVITSRAANRANVSKEAIFEVELPKTAFITNFTMTIDGVTYPGTIKEKEAAHQQYQQAVSRGQTAGLVKASGRKTEKFSVSVNIAPASKITFELTFEVLLKRIFGKYELFLKVNPKQLVNNFEIEANIFEPQGISYLEAEGSFITNDLLPVIQKTFSGKKGHVSFKPTIDQQRTCVNCPTTLLNGDFIIKYDVNRESPGDLQIVNGYFVHFFAPQNVSHLPKNIVFIIDVSISMSGRKLQQTKDALLKILEDIKEDDHLNFVLFGDDVHRWKNTLIKATPENLAEARRYVQNINIAGWTNLNGGLMAGIEMLNEAHKNGYLPERSASLIIMLTDGRPTKGERNTQVILSNVRDAIQGKYPLYNLGFGYDLDYGSLEKMAAENNGLARRIYEDSDSALQLQGFYDEVANPLLTEVELKYPENAISDLTQNSFKHYYDGSEIVVAGRIIDNDLNSIFADVKAHGAEDDVTYSEQGDIEQTAKALEDQKYIFGDYIERLWAYLTIQQLLEKRNAAKDDEKTNLTAQALELSLKYKFVTPLTSMVVTKPEDNEDKAAVADKPLEVESTYSSSPVVPVYAAQPTYHRYTSVDGDPHFIIDVPQKEDALCFNINEDPGVVLNLIRDPTTGITVNGQLTGDKKSSNDVVPIHNTYIGRLGILNTQLNFKIEITPENITLHSGTKQMTFTWFDEITLLHPGLTLKIIRKKNVEVSMGEGATFVVVLHQAWRKHAVHQDFLGFYTLDSHRLSEHTHGLLGQFFHPIDFNILEVHPGSDPEKPDATMIVKNNQLTVTRGWQKDYTEDVKHGTNVPCWFIHNNGQGLIDGTYTDYVVPSLF
ncbi:inter-alpha-trypsin inhibitor heavy chain H3-like [Rhineura floridana]|uniref:inter-alpha-trypsin inhibitor heavy chain H3-like n=1 Tax=Rhineura floridana TaxID=261503 RepID=UPI002AC7FC84|nr:inter-alpha-trypsin inhibitor heavy chain H3-like [Rhineura floridana]